MDPIISTPRLKLSLVTKAERGSPEFEWLHALHSDEKATWWRYAVLFVIPPMVNLLLCIIFVIDFVKHRWPGEVYGRHGEGHERLSAHH